VAGLIAVLFASVSFVPFGAMRAANTWQGGYNLLRNADFNDGVLAPWQGLNPNGLSVRPYADAPRNYYVTVMSFKDKPASISQDVVFNETSTFEFSAMVSCARNENQEIRIVIWELGGGGSDSPTEEAFYTDETSRIFKVKAKKTRTRSKLRVEIYPDRTSPKLLFVDNAKLITIN
jgi:hypothetical protein